MKVITILALSLGSFNAVAETELVPLDIEPGYWETSVEIEQSQMIKDMLANLPAAQREMVLKQMESSMPDSVSKQCLTEESIKDMEKQLRENLGSQGDSCDFNVTKSTSTEFLGEINCQNIPTVVHTKVINSKRQESVATSTVPGMGETKVVMIGEWKSAACPTGS